MSKIYGLIIAIEEYPHTQELASLPGVIQSADNFYDWLQQTKRPDHIYYCAAPTARTSKANAGADIDDILAQLTQLILKARDQTSELYVYFAGHGFSFQREDWDPVTNVLVAANYTDRATGGRRCLNVSEIQNKLRVSLGKGNHFWFFDACRTLIGPNEISVGSSGIAAGLSEAGSASTFSLYATEPGRVALNNAQFSQALLKGLRGAGRAKIVRGHEYWVTFDAVRAFVKSQSKIPIEAAPGNGDGLVQQLHDVPLSKCTIRVLDGQSNDEFVLETRASGLSKRSQFVGPTATIEVAPLDYQLSLERGGKSARRLKPANDPVDLWDHNEVEFEMGSTGSVPAAASPVIEHPAPGPRASLRLTGPNTDVTTQASLRESVQPGSYTLQLIERGAVVAAKSFDVAPGQGIVHQDLFADRQTDAHRAIKSALRHQDSSPNVMFSESIGPLSSQSLPLWLAMLGASKIVAPGHSFEKMQDIGTADAAGMLAQDRGAIYVLSSIVEGNAPFVEAGTCPLDQVAVASSTAPRHLLRPIHGLERVRHAMFSAPNGPCMLPIFDAAGGGLALATAVLPGRVTLVVLARGTRGTIEIRQLMLRPFNPSLAPDDLLRSFHSPLEYIQFGVEAQSRFLKHRPLAPVNGQEQSTWNELLHGKSIDPIMSIVAAYDQLQRGEPRGLLTTAIHNLQRRYPEIPDVHLLAHLAKMGPAPATGMLPLFTEGCLASTRWMPAGLELNMNSPWTSFLLRPRS